MAGMLFPHGDTHQTFESVAEEVTLDFRRVPGRPKGKPFVIWGTTHTAFHRIPTNNGLSLHWTSRQPDSIRAARETGVTMVWKRWTHTMEQYHNGPELWLQQLWVKGFAGEEKGACQVKSKASERSTIERQAGCGPRCSTGLKVQRWNNFFFLKKENCHSVHFGIWASILGPQPSGGWKEDLSVRIVWVVEHSTWQKKLGAQSTSERDDPNRLPLWFQGGPLALARSLSEVWLSGRWAAPPPVPLLPRTNQVLDQIWNFSCGRFSGMASSHHLQLQFRSTSCVNRLDFRKDLGSLSLCTQ